MKRPRFGQFLVNNGIVDKAAILEALVIQASRQENIAQIAIAKKYLTVKQVMQVFNKQPDTASYFTDIAISLGHLNEEQVKELIVLRKQTQPLLGEILVEMGALECSKLESMLSKFCMISSAA